MKIIRDIIDRLKEEIYKIGKEKQIFKFVFWQNDIYLKWNISCKEEFI